MILILALIWASIGWVLVWGLAMFARKDRALIAALYERLDRQAEELAAWDKEAEEIADAASRARFDKSLHEMCALGDEQVAKRIVAVLERQGLLNICDGELSVDPDDRTEARDVILRELQNAWKPDAGEEVA